MRAYEQARFYSGCPRCGVKPGERCITPNLILRSNHPERNDRWAGVRERIHAEVDEARHGRPEERR